MIFLCLSSRFCFIKVVDMSRGTQLWILYCIRCPFSFFLPSFPPSFFFPCVWGGVEGKEELIFVLNSLVNWKSTQGWSSTADSSASVCVLRAQVDAAMPSSSFFIPNAQELCVLLGQQSVSFTCPLPLFVWHLLLALYF